MIQDIVKNEIVNNKKEVEMLQWSVISGIASWVYSEYITRFEEVTKLSTVICIRIPTIKDLKRILDIKSDFMQRISIHMMDDLLQTDIMKKYRDIPEVSKLYNNTEMFKFILDSYILPNVEKRIPETISKKFDLENPNNQLFRECSDIEFYITGIGKDEQKTHLDEIYQYLILETSIHYIMNIHNKEDYFIFKNIDGNSLITSRDNIVTLNNENGITPIHLIDKIVEIPYIWKLLSFVTSTDIKIGVGYMDINSIPYNTIRVAEPL